MVASTGQRVRANRKAWLALTGSFALALTASSVVAVLVAGDVEFLPGLLVVDAISGALFGLCSTGILLRHRTVATRRVMVTGAILGGVAYAAMWVLWLATAPSFRHAVPFDLLPVALSFLFGLASSAAFYMASSDEEVLTSQ